MKAVITGMGGTVAPVMAQHLRQMGWEILPFPRQEIGIENREAIVRWICDRQPERVLHFGMGSPAYAGCLAGAAAESGAQFLFVSTVNVYSEKRTGPHDLTSPADAEEEYGMYKRECEKAVVAAFPRALIVRIGWQIGTGRGGNQMMEYLYRQMEVHGKIRASSRWYPSCSFLDDSASALCSLLDDGATGLYLANGNRSWSFFELVSRLAGRYASFIVEEAEDFTRDDRMIDERVRIRTIQDVMEERQ